MQSKCKLFCFKNNLKETFETFRTYMYNYYEKKSWETAALLVRLMGKETAATEINILYIASISKWTSITAQELLN